MPVGGGALLLGIAWGEGIAETLGVAPKVELAEKQVNFTLVR